MGPKDIAKTFKMKKTVMSKNGIGYDAANGSKIKNYGEKNIIGYTEAGDGMSRKVQCAVVKKALGSVHKMNLGGNAVVLDGSRSYVQNKEMGRKSRMQYENGQYVVYLWVPLDHKTKEEEENKVLKGTRFAILATEKESTKKDFPRRV